MSGPYGGSADEQARKRRDEAQRRLEAEHAWGFHSSPDDEGRQRHQQRRREQGKPAKDGCLAVLLLVAGTVLLCLGAAALAVHTLI